jgi:hypothetical protein
MRNFLNGLMLWTMRQEQSEECPTSRKWQFQLYDLVVGKILDIGI